MLLPVHRLFEGNTGFRRDVEKLARVHPGLGLFEHLAGVGQRHDPFTDAESANVDLGAKTLGDLVDEVTLVPFRFDVDIGLRSREVDSADVLRAAIRLFSCFAVEVFLVRQRLRFGFMNRTVAVLGRRVETVEFQFFLVRAVYDVVFRTRRDDHRGAVGNSMFDTIENRNAFAGLDSDELVQCVGLFTNLLFRPEAH